MCVCLQACIYRTVMFVYKLYTNMTVSKLYGITVYVSVYTYDMHGRGFYVLWDIHGNVCIHVFICIYMCPCTCVSCMLSAVSQCARRGPVYLVFITKPFTEAPIRIKPLSAHTDHRTQPASTRV